jgi:hypothetical protein
MTGSRIRQPVMTFLRFQQRDDFRGLTQSIAINPRNITFHAAFPMPYSDRKIAGAILFVGALQFVIGEDGSLPRYALGNRVGRLDDAHS